MVVLEGNPSVGMELAVVEWLVWRVEELSNLLDILDDDTGGNGAWED